LRISKILELFSSVAGEVMRNPLPLFSVSRNKESFDDVDVGKQTMAGAKGNQGLSCHPQQRSRIRKLGGACVSARDGRPADHLPVWQVSLFINPYSKRIPLFLCSFLCCHPPNSIFTCVTLQIQENCLWNISGLFLRKEVS
jgi:hypothetical protein